MLNQINWQLEERSDISTKWVLQNLKSEGAAPIWWWLQAWFPIQADFYQWFAFQEVILVPLAALHYSPVARLFFFKLPPPHWLLQNSFSENKLLIERTIEHHSLESYFVYTVCVKVSIKGSPQPSQFTTWWMLGTKIYLWPQLAHDSRHAMWTLPSLQLF